MDIGHERLHDRSVVLQPSQQPLGPLPVKLYDDLPSVQDEWGRIRQWFARQKTAFPQAVTADHPETMKQFVYRDIGYTFSPLLAVQEDVKSGRLRTAAGTAAPIPAVSRSSAACGAAR